jgi:Holliday junction resolvase
MLWILGFSVHRIGAGHYTSENVDIIARTPKGDYLLVECTTGLLKRQHKLANLTMRTATARRVLANTWNANARVLPIIVTSLDRNEVLPELLEAQQDGVGVFTAEDISEIIRNRTLFPPNADHIFTEIEAEVGSALKRT